MSFFLFIPIILLFVVLYNMLVYASHLQVLNSFRKNMAFSEESAKTLERLGLEDRMNAPALNFYVKLIEKNCIHIVREEIGSVSLNIDINADAAAEESEMEGVEYVPGERPTPVERFWLDEKEYLRHDYTLAQRGIIALLTLILVVCFAYWLMWVLL